MEFSLGPAAKKSSHFKKKVDFWFFANQMPATALLPPTVHSEGVSRGRVCDCGCLR